MNNEFSFWVLMGYTHSAKIQTCIKQFINTCFSLQTKNIRPFNVSKQHRLNSTFIFVNTHLVRETFHISFIWFVQKVFSILEGNGLHYI